MNPQTLLNRPKPQIVPKITKISGLVDSSNEIKKSSTKLRKVFEKGTYQKKTQLTTLNRYKKRLDAIQKQNDKRFSQKSKVKIKLPDIKKYAGSFFTAGSTSDPLKSIAALAAFNSASKAGKGDWLGAVGPGLVAAGLLFGPGLIKGGINLARGGAKPDTTPTGSRIIGGSPYSQTRAGQAYAGMQAQRNLPNWAQKAAGGSASRFAASNERLIQGTANIGDRARVATGGRFGVGNIAERVAAKGGRAATQTSTRAGGTIAAKAAGVGARAIPLLGAALNIGLSAYRFSQGDVVGGILSAVSAIPIVGWAALGIDLAREFGAFDGTFLGRKDKLKEQTERQKQAVGGKKEESGALTFRKTLNSYEKAVDKFEEFSKTFVPSTRAKSSYVEGGETAPPPPPPGQNIVADTQVVQDAVDFRNQFPLGRGTPNVSMTPYELHLRENTMLHAAGIGNDPTVERVHTQGSAHYSNRAIDIPVNSKELGDRVAQFWRSRGYNVIWWTDPDHKTHVHVQWNAASSQAGSPTTTGGGSKGYIITPGHASGGGAPGEKALVKKLAIDAYNKIKRQNPNAPVQYMDLDSMFADTDAGWDQQKNWYKNMEGQGYEVLEIHMDQKGGIGKGVIRSHNKQSSVSNAWISKGNYAYPMDWRSKPGEDPLAGPFRGVDLFELGKMKSGQYTQRDIDALTSPFVSAFLSGVQTPQTSNPNLASSIRGSVRQTSVPLSTRLPYQQGYGQQVTAFYPVSQPQQQMQQMMPSGSSGMMMSGPSEQDLLNSFYKRVLLNTV